MVVEIQHEKLGAKLHTDTFSYVKTCTRTRPCKSIHLGRRTSFYSEDVSQSLALVEPKFSDMVSYVKSCTLRRICELKVVWFFIVSGTSIKNYKQRRLPMWKLTHGHVSKVKNGAQTRVFVSSEWTCLIIYYDCISSAAFSTAALYISVASTLNIAFIWASRNSLRLWNCAQHAYSQLTFRR